MLSAAACDVCECGLIEAPAHVIDWFGAPVMTIVASDWSDSLASEVCAAISCRGYMSDIP